VASKVKRKFPCYQAGRLFLKNARQRESEQALYLAPSYRSTIGGTLDEFHQDY
jgi:hypothetical protein